MQDTEYFQEIEGLHEQETVDGVFALKVLQPAAFVRHTQCISGFPDATEGAASLLAVFFSDLQASQKIYLLNLVY